MVRYAGTETPVAVECKARVSSAGAHHIVYQAQRLEMPLVVVAAEITGKARDILSRAGIGSVDGLGNIRLELPGLLLRVAGTGRVERSPTPTRLSGKSGLVAQAMLLDLRRSWHVSELSEHSGVSAGLAHRVLRRLEGEDVVESRGAGPRKTRRLTNPAALLDLWAEEQHDRPSRRPAFMLAQTFDRLVNSLCTELERGLVDHALTGPAAVARIAPFVTNVTVAEVWLGSTTDPSDICARLGATPVETGPNVVFLQASDDGPLAFRSRATGAWTVNIFRLYVDLLREPRRGQEQADHLRQEAIGF